MQISPRQFHCCLFLSIFATLSQTSSALSTERRISRLRPWSKIDQSKSKILGWAIEERQPEEGTLKISVGWGSDQEGDSLTIELPTIKHQESLASTLWPPALATAILCRSPQTIDLLKDKAVLELGSGLGLAGLAASDVAASCHLTDNDDNIVSLLKDLVKDNDRVEADLLEWRDEDRKANIPEADVVLGADIAYYYFLLRPLMDTLIAYMKPRDSACLVIGQANRESQWNLYHNIKDGCYNQLTDNKDDPWEGSTKMLLYSLEMSKWQSTESTDEEEIDGIVPLGAILHRTPGMGDCSLTECDYVATEEDEDSMAITF
jgi:predicted nicotinamide N-methyase